MRNGFVWQPDDDYIKRSRLKRFMDKYGIEYFSGLIARSTADIEWFWNAVIEDLNIEFYRPYDKVVDLSNGIQFPKWCVNGKMNIIHNMLDKYIGTAAENKVAVRSESEDGTTRVMSYRDLWTEVNRLANALDYIKKLNTEITWGTAIGDSLIARNYIALWIILSITWPCLTAIRLLMLNQTSIGRQIR
jgi:hypothetical protein